MGIYQNASPIASIDLLLFPPPAAIATTRSSTTSTASFSSCLTHYCAPCVPCWEGAQQGGQNPSAKGREEEGRLKQGERRLVSACVECVSASY